MPGVRIHHPTLRNAVLAVSDPAARYGRGPVWCSFCQESHTYKTRHIHLDHDGDSIVSETVWTQLQRMQQAGMTVHRFLVLNQVAQPPPIRIDLTSPQPRRDVWADTGDTLHQKAG